MDIRLKPETEALIQRDLERGRHSTPEEVIEQALAEYHEREDWLLQHRAEIAQKIEEGWQSAKQGPLMAPDEVKAAMEAHKATWLSPNRKE